MNNEILDRARTAKRQVVEGSTELWNARLELLSRTSDVRAILDHLRSPIEAVADNANCGNCACGLESLSQAASLPAIGAARGKA